MNLTEVLSLIAIILGSNWLGSLIVEIYKNRKKRLSPFEKLVMAMGRDRLLMLSKSYLSKGFIPDDEYESFHEMGQSYLDLGGNSQVKHRYEEALKLPVKIEE